MNMTKDNFILRLKSVSKRFGGLTAVDNLSFDVCYGQILGLIGPNGAGKTTVFNLISGISPADSGKVEFMGEDITNLKSYMIAKRGISRTFQEIRLFKGLSVLDNVKVAGYMSSHYSLMEALFHIGRVSLEEQKLTERSVYLLNRFGLADFVYVQADDLPYGLQKRLEIVKALITNPRLVLLDEPAAGLNTEETLALMDLVKEIKSELNLTILIIEHTMELIQGITDHVIVMNFGQKIAEGTWDNICKNKEVVNCYLGEE